MIKDIVIDLIVTNYCNKACNYCCIKFNWKKIDKINIDYLIDYLSFHRNDYNKCTINFFWWEPLLNYENIVYFIEKNKNPKINYSIWTNGLLLNSEMLNFFKKNNVKIIISFHSDIWNSYKLLFNFFLLDYENIEINFIVSPYNIEENYKKIDSAIKFWFKKINIIPVILTQRWNKSSLIKLSGFIDYVDKKYINNNLNNNLIISKYSYFDWIINEKVFVIDYDLNIFQDSSDELYIWKQFPNIGKQLISEIEKVTYLWNIKLEKIPFLEIINKHNIKNIFSLIYKIPKKMGYVNNYYLIYRIMNKNKKTNNKIRVSHMIFGVS